MEKITIIFQDGSKREYDRGVTVREVISDIGEQQKALVAKVNGKLVDLSYPIHDDVKLNVVTFLDEEGKDVYRHSTSHIMAQAVKDLFPDVKLGIGPSIKDGFYYDFDKVEPFSESDLERIEERMREIIKDDLSFERIEMKKEEAKEMLLKNGDIYKLELLEELPTEEVTFYKQGNFIDLCKGPHIPSTGHINAFRLTSIAGAYWRGDERNRMLNRIYGTSFEEEDDLLNYLCKLEEAKKRDHRRLGRRLEIFNTYEEAGGGLIFYHPDGEVIRSEICSLLKKEHRKRGYLEVTTPHIAKIDLWRKSGHCEFYKENMYFINKEGEEYVLKPMNCPGHILIYQSERRSYKELPIRYFELGTVYRYERSGVLHGLLRVRGFTQDDAHIFCIQDQLKDEIRGVIEFAFYMLKIFGFSRYEIYLSTRPEKYVGTEEIWEKATSALSSALEEMGLDYAIDEGAGVFYGPKIDIKLKDALDRSWQGPTIQVDFNLPSRFNVIYIGADGKEHRPVMIHRVVLGSLERFIGTLIEHYGGTFPTWLAPTQAVIMTLASRHEEYARRIQSYLIEGNIRCSVDSRPEKLSFKIREAQLKKIPYMLIVGDREIETETVAIRKRDGKDLGRMELSRLREDITTEINEKII
ncbi:MAG: threonine--tRNA ligase [bacterium]|nr:threonine--tRNA ligase [bacterium]